VISTRSILTLPDGPAKRAALAQLGIAPPPRRAKRGTGRTATAKQRWCAEQRRAVSAMAFTIPVRTVNPSNQYKGRRWAETVYRKRMREATAMVLVGKVPPSLPVVVTLTRCGRGVLDSHDGLRAALKPVVDELADFLGCDDGDEAAVTWEYAPQVRQREWEVRVDVKGRTT
jgi:hypothetical protein